MVGGIKATFGLRGRLAPANNSSRTAGFGPRGFDGVFAVETAGFDRQLSLSVPEYRAVLVVRKRPADQDEAMCGLRLRG